MPTISNRVRDQLFDLMKDEIKVVQAKAAKEADAQWQQAERDTAIDLGYDHIIVRIEHIKNQLEGLQQELRELEGMMPEKAQSASAREYRDAGMEVQAGQYGHVLGRHAVFDHVIKTSWDCLVLKRLNSQVPFSQVYLNLAQLQHTMRRELLLCGNFNEARSLYQRFHEKIGAAIGDELPGLLSEVQALPALQMPGDN